MTRRMIHEKIWRSNQFLSLTDKAKLLYIGLISVADDDGRFQANWEVLAGNFFIRNKIGKIRIEKMLNEIEKNKLVKVYEENGERFGVHPNWNVYQTIREDRRKHSSIPAPMATTWQPTDNQPTAQHSITKENITKPSVMSVMPVPSAPTPAATMREFIHAVETQSDVYFEAVARLKNRGIPLEVVELELKKFTAYWTEPNLGGTKQRWEMEKVFEVTRRLSTWFSRMNNFRTERREKKGIRI